MTKTPWKYWGIVRTYIKLSVFLLKLLLKKHFNPLELPY